MCLAVPGELISIEGTYGTADIMGLESKIFIGLIASPQIGDFVLIHAGCAIEKIDKNYSASLEYLYKHILEESEECYE